MNYSLYQSFYIFFYTYLCYYYRINTEMYSQSITQNFISYYLFQYHKQELYHSNIISIIIIVLL